MSHVQLIAGALLRKANPFRRLSDRIDQVDRSATGTESGLLKEPFRGNPGEFVELRTFSHS